VRDAIQQLPAEFREIILLREYEELPYQEIASETKDRRRKDVHGKDKDTDSGRLREHFAFGLHVGVWRRHRHGRQ
jgi:hypothetical protein